MNYEEFRRFYNSQPHEVSIETQAVCNARCTFCPYPTLERIGTKMPDALLDRLMAEFEGFSIPFYFSPFKVNEPFLDKRLIPLCQRFNERIPHGAIRLFTNGSALTDKNIEGVAGLKRVAHLWISLNEHRPKEYEKLMGLNFAQTTKRLDRLHEVKASGSFGHDVVVSRVGSDPEFFDYVGERWPLFTPTQIKKDAWIDFTEADDPRIPNSPCVRWWELNISADGIVRTCCMDSGENPKFAIGDLNKQTMLGVYNAPHWKERREKMLSRRDVADPCNRCSY